MLGLSEVAGVAEVAAAGAGARRRISSLTVLVMRAASSSVTDGDGAVAPVGGVPASAGGGVWRAHSELKRAEGRRFGGIVNSRMAYKVRNCDFPPGKKYPN